MSDDTPTSRLHGSNGSSSAWTPELEMRVEVLSAKGLTAREIGAMVGLTKNQIIGWLWRNYYGGPTTADRLDALHAKMDTVRAEWNALRAKGGVLYTNAVAPRLLKSNGGKY